MTVEAARPPDVEITGLQKSYGQTRALRGLDLQMRAGEILGIAGPNGAGKTTLVRLLAGEEPPDAGEIRVGGRGWNPGDPAYRVVVVHQEPQIWTNLTLGENLLVGRELYRVGRPILSAGEHRILAELEILEFMDRPLADCSLAVRQRAEIGRAIAQDARLFLFDEPNSALTEAQSNRLFTFMHSLASQGRVVVLVSHRLAELVAHCARVVVIRNGRVAAELSGADLTQTAIAQQLVVGVGISPAERAHGQEMPAAPEPGSPSTDPGQTLSVTAPALELRGWSHPGERFREVDLDVARGEIVALVGVEGSGSRELLASAAGYALGVGHRAIGGAQGPEAISKGSVYLSADRRGMLFRNLSVGDNLVMRLGSPEIALRSGFLIPARLRALATSIVARFGVRTSGQGAPLTSLSGGNQQKVAIAAAIVREPTLLALEEPTRGVDVGAKRDIYGILRSFAASGGGVLLYCTEIPEVFELADRVVVVDHGWIARTHKVADYPDVSALAAEVSRAEHTVVADPRPKVGQIAPTG